MAINGDKGQWPGMSHRERTRPGKRGERENGGRRKRRWGRREDS